MEKEAMEQMRARLAAATSAATALAKSLESVDENTLQTLQQWMASQEGEPKCGHCRAHMLRGMDASVCIACGSERPPLHNSVEFNFKVSVAFLQFLETIHPPMKQLSGTRKWEPTLLSATERPGPSPIVEDQAVAATAETEDTQSPREDSSVSRSLAPSDSLETSPDEGHGVAVAEDDVEIDEFGDFQETAEVTTTEISLERKETETTPDTAPAIDYNASDMENIIGRDEPAVVTTANGTSEAVSNWDTDWDYPPVHTPAKVQMEESLNSESSRDIKEEAISVPTYTPDYDLSFFETFGGGQSKEDKCSPDIGAAGDFWNAHAKNSVVTKLAGTTTMQSFTSDMSAFTTFTDVDSDSEDSSSEALPPPKPPLDILLEVGGSGREEDLLWPLESFDGVGDLQKVAVSSDPLSTAGNGVDPFSWPLETLDQSSSSPITDDFPAAPIPIASNSATSVGIAVDPFPWPLEEFDQPTVSPHVVQDQEVPNPVASSPLVSATNGIDPFPWPLETFDQPTPALDKADETGIEAAPHVQAENSVEADTEDWDDEEFVWSQAEPADQFRPPSNFDDPFPSVSGPSPLKQEFLASTFTGEISIEKDRFLLDQSSPKPTRESISSPLVGNVSDLDVGLESLVTSKGQVPTEEDDFFKSLHVRSVSFGDADKKSVGLDQIDDLFKRSVSFGNLQINNQTQGDDLLKALQTPSVPPPTLQSSEPGEDMLKFLNLKPASSPQIAAPQSGNYTKPAHTRSVSFGTLELVPDEQSDEMFQFFHTRSHSAGSSENKAVPSVSGNSSSTSKDIFDRLPSMVETPQSGNPSFSDDPFNFIQAAVASRAKPQTAEVKEESAVVSPAKTQTVDVKEETAVDDDDDDFFEWKSAETPAAVSVESSFPPDPLPPILSPVTAVQPNFFQWTSPTSTSFPVVSPSKPSGNGSPGGLFSLADGFAEKMPTKQTSPDDDVFFQALPRKSPSGGGQSMPAASSGDFFWPQPTSVQPAYDSEDEFTDFVSNGAPASAPPLLTTPKVTAGLASKPALDVSFFEQAQFSSGEKRNLDFFSDLMGLNFTNA